MKSDSFESERLLFREVCAADAEDIVRWRSNPEIHKHYLNPNPITIKSHLEWYENKYLPDSSRTDFIITERASSISIGTAGVSNINYITKSCEVNYAIGEASFQGRGYASEAVRAIIEHFEVKGITTFYATVHKDNAASAKVVEKNGFECFEPIEEKMSQNGIIKPQRSTETRIAQNFKSYRYKKEQLP